MTVFVLLGYACRVAWNAADAASAAAELNIQSQRQQNPDAARCRALGGYVVGQRVDGAAHGLRPPLAHRVSSAGNALHSAIAGDIVIGVPAAEASPRHRLETPARKDYAWEREQQRITAAATLERLRHKQYERSGALRQRLMQRLGNWWRRP